MELTQESIGAAPSRQDPPHKIIRTKLGIEILVDESDYEWLNQWKWCITQGHITRKVKDSLTGKKHTVYMHRLIMGVTDPKVECDHRNCIRHDNRRKNLRTANRSENCCNKKMHGSNTSGFKGVCWNTQQNKWQAKVNKDGRSYHAGFHENKEDAARAYDQKAILLHGEFVRTNFPLDSPVQKL